MKLHSGKTTGGNMTPKEQLERAEWEMNKSRTEYYRMLRDSLEESFIRNDKKLWRVAKEFRSQFTAKEIFNILSSERIY